MSSFFHVSSLVHLPGSVISPGNWGKQTRQFAPAGRQLDNVKDANILMWEVALETARLVIAPAAPSRLECVFGCSMIDDAIAFRDRFRSGAAIFEIERDNTIPVHFGNYEAITFVSSNEPIIDHKSSLAISYWRDKPTGITEVLIGGAVKVLRRAG